MQDCPFLLTASLNFTRVMMCPLATFSQTRPFDEPFGLDRTESNMQEDVFCTERPEVDKFTLRGNVDLPLQSKQQYWSLGGPAYIPDLQDRRRPPGLEAPNV